MKRIIGWDIGGANIKATRIKANQNLNKLNPKKINRYFEFWQEKRDLVAVLKEIYQKLGPADYFALTMTAELSDTFTTKKEGVIYIIKAFQQAFPKLKTYILTTTGNLISPSKALASPLTVAAANWIGSASYIADFYPNLIYTDLGSTTTDIIPIINGEIYTNSRNDISRLSSGELLYLGALRTNLSSLVEQVPWQGNLVSITRELFAITGDLHLVLGYIKPDDYTVSTPDGKGKDVLAAQNRIARLVGGDQQLLKPAEIKLIAKYIFAKELSLIKDSILKVYSNINPELNLPLMPTGKGRFLLEIVAQELNLKTIDKEEIKNLAAEKITTSLGVGYLALKEVL